MYHTYISEPFFQFGGDLQKGWGEVEIRDSEVSITGKKRASGLATVLLGALIASAVAKKKTLAIRYGNILDVSASGKKVTLQYRGAKGKKRRLYLQPFAQKGFWGGKDSRAQELVEKVQEKCSQ